MTPDMTPGMTLHDITGVSDPHLPAAMDLYQSSFPDRECAPLSWWFTFWKDLAEAGGRRFFTVALTDRGEVAGIALHEVFHRPPETVGYLMYLAIAPDTRGKGVGAWLLGEVLQRCFDRSCRGVVWEVEDPAEVAQSQNDDEAAAAEAAADLARRRIAFYRRSGARLLGGVRYELDLHRSGLAPFPMHIMAAGSPLSPPLTPEDALRLANIALSADDKTPAPVQQIGPLTLD